MTLACPSRSTKGLGFSADPDRGMLESKGTVRDRSVKLTHHPVYMTPTLSPLETYTVPTPPAHNTTMDQKRRISGSDKGGETAGGTGKRRDSILNRHNHRDTNFLEDTHTSIQAFTCKESH